MTTHCANCFSLNAQFFCPCGTETYYCGNDCASAHWKEHQLECIGAAKRERDTTIDDDEDITLVLKDGEEIKVKGAYIKHMVTIRHLVEDAGTDEPIPLPNINRDTMERLIDILVAYSTSNMTPNMTPNGDQSKTVDGVVLERIGKFSNLIELTIAVNYLDIDLTFYSRINGNYTKLLDLFGRIIASNNVHSFVSRRPNLNQLRMISNLPGKNGFTDEELKHIDDSEYMGPDIRQISLPAPNLGSSLFQLNNDIMLNIVLPWYSNDDWRQLHQLRMRHIGLWRVVTRYMLRLARKFFPELSEFSDEDVFKAASRIAGYASLRSNRSSGGDEARGEYGLSPKDLSQLNETGTGKTGKPNEWRRRDVVIASLKKYGSWDELHKELQKRKERATKAKQTKEQNIQTKEENRKNNTVKLRNLLLKEFGIKKENRYLFSHEGQKRYDQMIEGPPELITINHEVVLTIRDMMNLNYDKLIRNRQLDELYEHFSADRFLEAVKQIHQEDKKTE